MSIEQTILNKLAEQFQPLHLEVENESNQHNVPPGSESHFRVVLVSELFEGLNLVKRHQSVYQTLADEMSNAVHALALHTFTESEWLARQQTAASSPACMGGGKKGAQGES